MTTETARYHLMAAALFLLVAEASPSAASSSSPSSSSSSTSASSSAASSGGLKEQKFAMEPQDQTAVVNSRVTLPCRVMNRVGTLQWTKDDFGLGTHRNLSGFDRYSMIGSDEEGDYSLEIYPVMLDDDGRYQCQVSPGPRGEDGIRSHYATVTVLVPPEPPKIVQGDYLVTTEDREIELACVSYGGKPASEITWIDGHGNVLQHGIETAVEEIAGTRRFNVKSRLRLTPRKEHHNTTFTCQAQNTAERTHQSARLKLEVKYAPKVTVSVVMGASANGRIPEGADVRLACRADANPSDVTYRWFLNDQVVVGDYTTEVLLHNVSRKYHDAIVKCEVHNSVGKSEESETLDVSYGPQFRARPRSTQAEIGESVTLQCDVDGNPPPDISWYHGESTRSLSSSPNLTLRVDPDTAGVYRCRAHVPGFADVGAEASVYLKGPPSIVSHRTQFGIEGDNVRVECTAYSIPAPQRVVWTFDGREVDVQDQEYSILEDPLPEGIKSTLIIRESQEKHFGTYNCSVTNPYGSDVVEINLKPQTFTESFPMLVFIVGFVVAVIVLGIVIVIVFLWRKQCRRKIPEDINNTIEKQCKESDRSSNISDLKLDLRTDSAQSNVVACDDYVAARADSETGSEATTTKLGVPLAGPVSLQMKKRYPYDYIVTTNQKNGKNNNGYVAFCDYERDYSPPPMQALSSSSVTMLVDPVASGRLQSTTSLNSMGGGGGLPMSDLTDIRMLPNGNLPPNVIAVDPRFSAAYGNPFLKNGPAPGAGLPTPNTANPAATPAPPPYVRSVPPPPTGMVVSPIGSTSAVGLATIDEHGNIGTTTFISGAGPQVSRLPASPTSQYILPPGGTNAASSMRRPRMATHV